MSEVGSSRVRWFLLLMLAGCELPLPSRDAGPVSELRLPDGGLAPVDGIVFVHGINGSSADWSVMRDRFLADGWPAERLVAHSYEDASWGCNTLNADQLSRWVGELEAVGAKRIAIVAHSMGGLSSRYFVKDLGGNGRVSVFTTLGTMHHGLAKPCQSPVSICVWDELCSTGAFITNLNAAPATPGPTAWTSIFSDADQTVPNESSLLDGAKNVLVHGYTHDGVNGLQDAEEVYRLVVESLK